MKLKLIGAYKTRRTVKDENGLPVLAANGQPQTKLTNMFRYGLTDYTDEELMKYKRYQAQSGTDYYREEKGIPLYFSSQHLGRETTINSYTRTDGTLGFSIDDTQVIELESLAEQFPAMAPTLIAQITSMRLAGKKLDMEALDEDGNMIGKAAEKKETTGATAGGGEENEEEDLDK